MTDTAELKFTINLLADGSVATRDGEYLGIWDTDETDAFYRFTPDGASEPVFVDLYRHSLCNRIEQWCMTTSS